MKTYSKISIAVSAVLMIIMGAVVLFNPAATLVSLSWLIGIMTLISGIAVLVFYFSAAMGMIGAGTVLFTGIADVIMGLVFLNHGWFMAEILTFIAGLWLTVFGIERFIRSFDLKKLYYDKWWLTMLVGIACFVLGVMSMITPITGAILVSVVLGLGFIIHGAALFTFLYIVRKSQEEF